MVQYIQVATEQIPAGMSALLLFVEQGQLCAGVVEHSRDGRIERRVPDHPMPTDLVPIICELMARQHDNELYVVLEPAAYWPEPFPTLGKM